MNIFVCACGARLFFDNTQCLACGRELGFFPNPGVLAPVDATFPETEGRVFSACEHRTAAGFCNWMVDSQDESPICLACRLDDTAPPSADEEERRLWAIMAGAKRRLLYTLGALGLPVVPKSESSLGLAFSLRRSTPDEHVLTGHSDGLITLNLAEADAAERERQRQAVGESYRTVLGHFRHEVGHYFWQLFAEDAAWLEEFRAAFGDERADYGEALAAHYGNPRLDFAATHISSYATAHPWEDWAETWAHYLHFVDSAETAAAFGLRIDAAAAVAGATPHSGASAESEDEFGRRLNEWTEIMIALNSLNRSMGLSDAYPFHIAMAVREKLRFVERTIRRGVDVSLFDRHPPDGDTPPDRDTPPAEAPPREDPPPAEPPLEAPPAGDPPPAEAPPAREPPPLEVPPAEDPSKNAASALALGALQPLPDATSSAPAVPPT